MTIIIMIIILELLYLNQLMIMYIQLQIFLIKKKILIILKINKEKKIDITNFYILYSDNLLYKIINKSLSEEEFTNLIILSISFYKKKRKINNKICNYALL